VAIIHYQEGKKRNKEKKKKKKKKNKLFEIRGEYKSWWSGGYKFCLEIRAINVDSY